MNEAEYEELSSNEASLEAHFASSEDVIPESFVEEGGNEPGRHDDSETLEEENSSDIVDKEDETVNSPHAK